MSGSAPGGSPAAERRTAIIETAFDRIAAVGFEGLRMRDVAAGVGLNIATVHYYFKSKNDLVEAVVEDAHQRFRATKRLADELDGPTRLRQHVIATFDLLAKDRALGRVLGEIALRAGHDDDVAAIVRRSERQWAQALLEVLGAIDGAAAITAMIQLQLKGACLPSSSQADIRRSRDALLVLLDATAERRVSPHSCGDGSSA